MIWIWIYILHHRSLLMKLINFNIHISLLKNIFLKEQITINCQFTNQILGKILYTLENRGWKSLRTEQPLWTNLKDQSGKKIQDKIKNKWETTTIFTSFSAHLIFLKKVILRTSLANFIGRILNWVHLSKKEN